MKSYPHVWDSGLGNVNERRTTHSHSVWPGRTPRPRVPRRRTTRRPRRRTTLRPLLRPTRPPLLLPCVGTNDISVSDRKPISRTPDTRTPLILRTVNPLLSKGQQPLSPLNPCPGSPGPTRVPCGCRSLTSRLLQLYRSAVVQVTSRQLLYLLVSTLRLCTHN